MGVKRPPRPRRQSREPAAEPEQDVRPAGAAVSAAPAGAPGCREPAWGEGEGRERAYAPKRRDLPGQAGGVLGSAARRAVHVPRELRAPPAGTRRRLAGSAASSPWCSPAGKVVLFAPSECHQASPVPGPGAGACMNGRLLQVVGIEAENVKARRTKLEAVSLGGPCAQQALEPRAGAPGRRLSGQTGIAAPCASRR